MGIASSTKPSKPSPPEPSTRMSMRSTRTTRSLFDSETHIVNVMMPMYYSNVPITPEERNLAKQTWQLIVNDKAPEFLARRGSDNFPYQSAVTFFYDQFYVRLFDIHPICRHLFRQGMKSQGTFLFKMMTLALSELDSNPKKFLQTLKMLAKVHHERGVKAVEYGIVGEVLFWTLRQVLGQEVYSHAVHVAWVKVYNRMLSVIVPKAVALEVRKGMSDEHYDRLEEHQVAMFPGTEMKPTSFLHHHLSMDDDDSVMYGRNTEVLDLACESLRMKVMEGCPFHRTSWSDMDTVSPSVRVPPVPIQDSCLSVRAPSPVVQEKEPAVCRKEEEPSLTVREGGDDDGDGNDDEAPCS